MFKSIDWQFVLTLVFTFLIPFLCCKIGSLCKRNDKYHNDLNKALDTVKACQKEMDWYIKPIKRLDSKENLYDGSNPKTSFWQYSMCSDATHSLIPKLQYWFDRETYNRIVATKPDIAKLAAAYYAKKYNRDNIGYDVIEFNDIDSQNMIVQISFGFPSIKSQRDFSANHVLSNEETYMFYQDDVGLDVIATRMRYMHYFFKDLFPYLFQGNTVIYDKACDALSEWNNINRPAILADSDIRFAPSSYL